MNRKQKIVIVVGALLAAGFILFPPWYFPATSADDPETGDPATPADFDAFRWLFADPAPADELWAQVEGLEVRRSRPNQAMGELLGLGAVVLTVIAVFMLKDRKPAA